MDDDGAARRTALETAILDYLRIHPEAADTLPGIVQWWIGGAADCRDVEQAIEALVGRGLMRRIVLVGGTVLLFGAAEPRLERE